MVVSVSRVRPSWANTFLHELKHEIRLNYKVEITSCLRSETGKLTSCLRSETGETYIMFKK